MGKPEIVSRISLSEVKNSQFSKWFAVFPPEKAVIPPSKFTLISLTKFPISGSLGCSCFPDSSKTFVAGKWSSVSCPVDVGSGDCCCLPGIAGLVGSMVAGVVVVCTVRLTGCRAENPADCPGNCAGQAGYRWPKRSIVDKYQRPVSLPSKPP